MSALASSTLRTVASHSGLIARPARVADAPRVVALVSGWAERGLTIPRSTGDVLGSIGDFTVAEMGGGTPVACGALEVFSDREAEIRSVAVAPGCEGMGAGRAVVSRLLAEAEARGVARVCLLTRCPAFFARCGFVEVPHDQLSPAYAIGHVAGNGRTLTARNAMVCEITAAV